METLTTTNSVTLSGQITASLVYSHEVYGEKFFCTTISVQRLSGMTDVVPITLSERLMADRTLNEGDFVCIKGQFRSYNKIDKERSRLMLTVFIRDLLPYDDAYTNSIELSGFICKEPIFRTTPFMREICDCLLAVNRAYNKSDYIPCIAWGRNARYIRSLSIGDRLTVTGRIQSRQYVKKITEQLSENRTAFEVSINKIDCNAVTEPVQYDENVDQTAATCE
ncbi:MAG: single-stranded DNA-binding protein [Clostridia bacterium]|nr:single-stranded DNA-binding protein [Clostridia bacterium]